MQNNKRNNRSEYSTSNCEGYKTVRLETARRMALKHPAIDSHQIQQFLNIQKTYTALIFQWGDPLR